MSLAQEFRTQMRKDRENWNPLDVKDHLVELQKGEYLCTLTRFLPTEPDQPLFFIAQVFLGSEEIFKSPRVEDFDELAELVEKWFTRPAPTFWERL